MAILTKLPKISWYMYQKSETYYSVYSYQRAMSFWTQVGKISNEGWFWIIIVVEVPHIINSFASSHQEKIEKEKVIRLGEFTFRNYKLVNSLGFIFRVEIYNK